MNERPWSLALVACFIAGCNAGAVFPGGTQSQIGSSVHPVAQGGTIFVEAPTGSVEDCADPAYPYDMETWCTPEEGTLSDWQKIQRALISAAPGDTIQLAPGTYRVHRTLIRHVATIKRDKAGVLLDEPVPIQPGYNPVRFTGTIRGAGKDQTTIEAVRGPGGEPFPIMGQIFSRYFEQYGDDLVWATYQFPENRDKVSPRANQSFLLVLQYGAQQITVEDLSLKVDDDQPSTEHYHPFYDGQTTALNHLLFLMWGQGCKATIRNVRATGRQVGDIWAEPRGDKPLTAYGKNLIYPIIIGFTMGDTVIENSETGNAGGNGLEVFGSMKGSEVTLTGNTIVNSVGGIFGGTFGGQADMTDVTYTLSGNAFGGSVGGYPPTWDAGVAIINDSGGISAATIEGNTFTGFQFGIRLYNLGYFDVSDNEVFYSETGILLQESSNGKLSQNLHGSVTGELGAIFLQGASNNTISGNDYRQLGLAGWSFSAVGIRRSGAVLLDRVSSGNLIDETWFPAQSNSCTQVADLNLEFPNTVVGLEACRSEHDRLRHMIEQYADLLALGEELDTSHGHFPYDHWPAQPPQP